jgi:anti-sigma regulatory factor (Ser/Thr protein kinase)
MGSLKLSLEGGLSPALVDRLHDYVLNRGLSVPMSASLRPIVALVVEEICTNIMEHSGATWLELSLARRGGQVWVQVSDDGEPFNTGEAILARGDLCLQDVHERRLGLYMVKQLASVVRYGRDQLGHNRVEFEIDRELPVEDV